MAQTYLEDGLYKCVVCGKRVYLMSPESWAYRRGTRFYCSWGCLRKENPDQKVVLPVEDIESSSRASPPGKAIVALTPKGRVAREWESINACARFFHIKYGQTITRAIQKGAPFQGYILKYKEGVKEKCMKTESGCKDNP